MWQDSRRLALELAGKWRDAFAWSEAVRELRAKVSAASAAERQAAKDARRTQKKTEDDLNPGASAETAGSTVVTLRTGVGATGMWERRTMVGGDSSGAWVVL